jgi:hypothetical protein
MNSVDKIDLLLYHVKIDVNAAKNVLRAGHCVLSLRSEVALAA